MHLRVDKRLSVAQHLSVAVGLICLLLAPSLLARDYEDCSWKCKKIPPLSESYLVWAQPSSTQLRSTGFSILVWNIYKGREDEFSTEFFDFMQNADIALLQEATSEDHMQRAYDLVGDHEYHMAISFLMKRDKATGNVTSSRVPADIGQPLRTEAREPFSKSPKMNLVTRYPMDNGSSLLVINIHGLNFKDADELRKQYELTLPYIESHSGPIIFAGDFNTKNSEKMQMTDQWMSGLNLQRIQFTGDDRRKKLDHIYFRGLSVLGFELHKNVKGSDHPALTATFRQN